MSYQQRFLFPDEEPSIPTPQMLEEIDKLLIHCHNLQERRAAAQRELLDLGTAEKAALKKLDIAMRAAKLEQYQNECRYASYRRSEVPQVVDAVKLLEWSQKPDRRAMVNVSENRDGVRLRVNPSRWRRILRDGVEVPGVESVTEEKLRVNWLE